MFKLERNTPTALPLVKLSRWSETQNTRAVNKVLALGKERTSNHLPGLFFLEQPWNQSRYRCICRAVTLKYMQMQWLCSRKGVLQAVCGVYPLNGLDAVQKEAHYHTELCDDQQELKLQERKLREKDWQKSISKYFSRKRRQERKLREKEWQEALLCILAEQKTFLPVNHIVMDFRCTQLFPHAD